MKVTFSPEARQDLRDIAFHIADDNPVRAETFVDEIESLGRSLSSFAKRYPLVERYSSRGIRRANHGRYGIFYRVTDSDVAILRIVHSSRDLDGVFEVKGSCN